METVALGIINEPCQNSANNNKFTKLEFEFEYQTNLQIIAIYIIYILHIH